MTKKRSIEEIRKADAATVGELYGDLQQKITAYTDESPWQVAVDRHFLLAEIERLTSALRTISGQECAWFHDHLAVSALRGNRPDEPPRGLMSPERTT